MASKTNHRVARISSSGKPTTNFDYLNSGHDGYYARLAQIVRAK
jgi:hypothetical protein